MMLLGGIRVGNDPPAGLQPREPVDEHDRADRDARVERAVRQCVSDGAAVDAAPVALELRDDLHRANLRRAGDGSRGKARAQEVERRDPVAQFAGDLRDEVRDVREALRLEETLDADRPRPAHARQVIASEVDEHHVLRAVLLGTQERFRVALSRCDRAGNRVQLRARSLTFDDGLRRRADERQAVELQQEEVRRRVDPAQRAVQLERGRGGRPLGALRDDDLERVAGADVLLRLAHAPLVLRLLGEAAERTAPSLAARHRRQWSFERARVAAEHLRDAEHVIEADERVGDDEAALRQAWPVVRERHHRLQPRDVVVRHEADDGKRERLRLVEVDEPRPRADERAAAQASLLDRLEQERAAPAVAQAEVRPERGDEVGCDRCRHCTKKDPDGSRSSGTGCERSDQRRVPPRSLRQAQVCGERVINLSVSVTAASVKIGGAVALPDLLRDLLTTPGPSGHEAEAAAVWRRHAESFAEVSSDALGSSIARVKGTADGPTLALIGHIDEIGLAITHIDDKGFLFFRGLGGWLPEVLLAQRVEVLTRESRVPGVIGKKAGPFKKEKDEKIERNNRVASRSWDNRVGCYVALETARRVAEAGGAPGVVVAVAAVGEEVGDFAGARTTAYSVEPDVAIAIDVYDANDIPDGDPNESGDHPIGKPALGRGAPLSPRIFELLMETAEQEHIELSVEVVTGSTHTDADAYHLSRAGIPTGLVSIPTRYIHTPTELVSLDDVENAVRLLVAFAQRLER